MSAPVPSSLTSPVKTNLALPKDDVFTPAQLAKFNGTNGQPIYVAVKGTVFDVSAKKEMYGPGGSYAIFAGKDGSKGLGKSSLEPADAVAGYSDLNEKELAVLNQWYDFFSARYNIVGNVAS